jgi:hypothetical protein
MAAAWGEMFPPKASFTKKDIPDQHGRVFVVTGGSAGIGYEVVKPFITLMVVFTWHPARNRRRKLQLLQFEPRSLPLVRP